MKIDCSQYAWSGGRPGMSAACVRKGETIQAQLFVLRRTDSRAAAGGEAAGASAGGASGIPAGSEEEALTSGELLDDLERYAAEGRRKALDPPGLLRYAHEQLRERKDFVPGLWAVDALFCSIGGGSFHAAMAGNVRVQIYRDGELFRMSRENTGAYAAYEAGKIPCGEIRMRDDCLEENSGFGWAETPEFREIAEAPLPEDRILMATDGFWRFLFETEILVDALKTASAQEWMETMLVRLAEKTRMCGNAFSVVCASVLPE